MFCVDIFLKVEDCKERRLSYILLEVGGGRGDWIELAQDRGR